MNSNHLDGPEGPSGIPGDPGGASPNLPPWAVMGTERNVCSDIARRQAMGLKKYGVSVADNPLTLRQWLQHAYEETLDQAIYLKRAIEELDKLPDA